MMWLHFVTHPFSFLTYHFSALILVTTPPPPACSPFSGEVPKVFFFLY